MPTRAILQTLADHPTSVDLMTAAAAVEMSHRFRSRPEALRNTLLIAERCARFDLTHDLGYETTINIMAISKEIERDLVEALDQLADCPVDVVYVVNTTYLVAIISIF